MTYMMNYFSGEYFYNKNRERLVNFGKITKPLLHQFQSFKSIIMLLLLQFTEIFISITVPYRTKFSFNVTVTDQFTKLTEHIYGNGGHTTIKSLYVQHFCLQLYEKALQMKKS